MVKLRKSLVAMTNMRQPRWGWQSFSAIQLSLKIYDAGNGKNSYGYPRDLDLRSPDWTPGQLSHANRLFGWTCQRSQSRILTRDHLDALAVDGHRQNITAGLDDGRFHARAGIRLNQQDNATAAASSADLAGQSAVAPRAVNDAVYRLGRDGRQISLAERPF